MTNENGGMGAGTVILAMLGGAVAGAAAALLLAPRSGAETRAAIGDGIGEAGEQVKRARMAAREAATAAREAFTEAMKEH
jgi:gas vesicle protein